MATTDGIITRSVKGRYGVGVSPVEQKHPAGKLTAGKHSRPMLMEEIK